MADLMQNYNAFTAKPIVSSKERNIQAKEFGKVAVLLGGRSSEREVSLNSGNSVLSALQRKGVDAHPIDPDEHLAQTLINGEFDRAFIVLHGREGEDGVIQGLLQMLDIPFTGSGVAASALAMDKARAKLVMHGVGVATPVFGVAKTVEEAKDIAQKIGCPVSIKPIAEGSSIGVSRVNQMSDLPTAFAKASAYGDVIVEKWIDGRDFSVTVIGECPFPSIEIRAPGPVFDYEAKYQSDETQFLCPSPLTAEQELAIRDLGYRAFSALGCEGWGRVDLILDNQGKFWVLEVNTIPGMTDHSQVPLSARNQGLNFDELVLAILQTTLKESRAAKLVAELAQG